MTTSSDQQTFDQKGYDDALAKHGKTFHWAKRFLGARHGDHAAQLYAFCRLLDDLADGDLPNGKQRLSVMAHDLAAFDKDPDHIATDPALRAFIPFMRHVQLPAAPLHHLIDGLLFDQGKVALADQDALILYSYQVAGTVGLMMCPVLDCHDENASAFAIDMGIAMQLTNIARDVLEDAEMGRRYLPATLVDGLSADEIADAAATHHHHHIAIVQKAVGQILDLADCYYQSGFAGLPYLPKQAQIAIAIAAYAYRQIGHQLRDGGCHWHKGRTVTSSVTKARVSLKAARFLLPIKGAKTHDKTLQKPLEGYAK